jgi:hypothetical protein
VTAAERLGALVGPNLAGAILDALREELAAELADRRANGSEARWLTLEQAGARLGCSPDAVRMRVKRGRLETRRHGRRVYVAAASVDDLGGRE